MAEHQTGQGPWTGFCAADDCKCESPSPPPPPRLEADELVYAIRANREMMTEAQWELLESGLAGSLVGFAPVDTVLDALRGKAEMTEEMKLKYKRHLADLDEMARAMRRQN